MQTKSNQWMLWVVFWIATMLLLVILIPLLLVDQRNERSGYPYSDSNQALQLGDNPFDVTIYLTNAETVIHMPLEQYVRGVVAAEMPADFSLEALKAQAIASRTYIVRRVQSMDFSNVPVEGAYVTDSVQHQAFMTEEQMRKEWGADDFTSNWDKITQAVAETKGLIITYAGQPIDAAFFSTSNGYTENSEDYWGNEVPYLKSVASPWDAKISPKYKMTVTMPMQEIREKLGLSDVQQVSAGGSYFEILSLTEGNRLKEVRIGEKIFTARAVREKLGLASTHFTWESDGDKVHITTFGYGHGVGMSQYGAEGMAREGKKAEDILKYYYTGVEIEKF